MIRYYILYGFILSLMNVLPSFGQQYTQKTNLPTMYIETFDKASITDEFNYKYCKITYVTPELGAVTYDSVSIRGRGNTTWTLPKKPYRIKFKTKQKLLGKGHANAKSWVLLANAGDKLMMRNGLSSFLGNLMGMPFTPSCQFIDLYLNQSYQGTYQISDQMQVHKKRVDIAEQDTVVTSASTDITGGYFLEPEGLTDQNALYFSSNNGCHIRVHSPDPEVINSRQLKYIKAYINKFENALFSDYFTDEKRGYRQYTDTASLISWYLVNEISGNPDGFWCSYIYKERADEHLYFGPIWDFDICYNNCSRQGDVTKKLALNFGYGSDYTIKGWYVRMAEDHWFKQAVVSHFDSLRSAGLDSLMCHYVDSVAELIRPSRIENYKKWSLNTKTYDELYIFSTYEDYVKQIKTFIKAHNDYLTSEFHRRAGLTPTKQFVPMQDYCYRMFSKAFPNMLMSLDVNGDSANVSLYKNEEENYTQCWDVKPIGSFYQLINIQNGKALCDVGGGMDEIQIRTAQPDSNKLNQQWQFVPQSVGGYYNIKNVATGHVVYNFDGMADQANPIHGAISDERDAASGNRMWKPVTYGRPTLSAIEAAQANIDYALAYSAQGQTLRFVGQNPDELTFVAKVYSTEGRLQGTFHGNETYSTEQLPHGVYIVSWAFGGATHSAKFVKK